MYMNIHLILILVIKKTKSNIKKAAVPSGAELLNLDNAKIFLVF